MTAQTFKKGFTLVELLVVIAILGILAGAILVAINPLEQLARGRDAGRKSAIGQIGGAVQSYYAGQNNTYPTQGTDWMTQLKDSGELKILPKNPAGGGTYTVGCNTTDVEEVGTGYCYQTLNGEAIVYAKAESNSSKTAAGCAATGETAWVVWSSAEGKTGLTCVADGSDPAVGVTGLK